MAEASFTYGSNWDVEFFWHRMDWLVRFDIALLGLLLGYTVFVFIRVFLRWRALPLGQALNATIITELKCDVSTLKSISNTAPYLGLFGTCLAILSAFSGVGMERHAFIAWITSKIATALVPAAAGIIVSLPATFGYEFGRTWLDTLSVNFSGRNRLLTTGQFSQLPPFALIGAPALAILVMVCMTFSSFHIPKGLGLVIASERCGDGALSDRLLVLHITAGDRIFMNQEEELDWSTLQRRLTDIYSTRAERVLYVMPDEGVRFQTVADAIDAVQSASTGRIAGSLNISVRLATPAAVKDRCLIPIVTPIKSR